MCKDRDRSGRFRVGHAVGKAHRFKPGQPSPNPAGRPRGVNKWRRELGRRRYGRIELEALIRDEFAPPNQREAAMRLLLLHHERCPLRPNDWDAVEKAQQALAEWSNEDLCFLLVDAEARCEDRVAAHILLAWRGVVGPPPETLLRIQLAPLLGPKAQEFLDQIMAARRP